MISKFLANLSKHLQRSNIIKQQISSLDLELLIKKSIPDAIKFANAFAGISTTRIGTANSMPSREEIEKIL